jgi:transposase InsO family protein
MIFQHFMNVASCPKFGGAPHKRNPSDETSSSRFSHARTVMELLPSWFEDYNEKHPHKGLKMRSTKK